MVRCLLRWAPSCTSGRIEDCPCVFRSDDQLASLFKYDRLQYEADLRAMGIKYYLTGQHLRDEL